MPAKHPAHPALETPRVIQSHDLRQLRAIDNARALLVVHGMITEGMNREIKRRMNQRMQGASNVPAWSR